MIRCLKFRPYQKNTLQGFADLKLSRVGIIIHDCTFHRHQNGREWVGFPARSYNDKDGNTQRQALIEFAPDAKRTREQFQEQAIAAIYEFAAKETV